MNIKLKNLLFEENNISQIFEEFESNQELIEKTQDISKQDILLLSQALGKAFNSSFVSLDKLKDDKEEFLKIALSPMGSIDIAKLRTLANKSVVVKGVGLDPVGVKGQESGLSQVDFKKYSDYKVIPFWATNKNNERIKIKGT